MSLENYSRYVRPELGRVLSALKLDVVFEKAEGDQLYYRESARSIAVSDFLGGFGSTILGHNHPQILAAVEECQKKQTPQHAQASLKAVTAELGRDLNAILKKKLDDPRDFVMTLGNSGAEAVEIALKHALLEWQEKRELLLHKIKIHLHRGKDLAPTAQEQIWSLVHKIEKMTPVMIALEKGFHGKTAGAVSVTGNSAYRKMFIGSPMRVAFVEVGNIAKVEELVHTSEISLSLSPDVQISFSAIAGFLYEPIQGEGGIEEIPEEFLKKSFALFKPRHIPTICDEIQSGLYRTGKFLASEWYGLRPDYILLGKSFGGGVAKISAALIAKDHYVEEFGWLHTSTFAEDDWSSSIAKKTLEILQKEESVIVTRAQRFAARMQKEVALLQKDFPGIIQRLKGRGFFLGLEFNFGEDAPLTDMIQGLYEQGHATYVYTSYLLHTHQVRVGVTLSAPETLRLEPSAFVTDDAVDRLVMGLRGLCEVLSKRQVLKLTRHFWNQEFTPEQLNVVSDLKSSIKDSTKDSYEVHVGFLTHVLTPKQARSLDKALRHVHPDQLEKFLKKYSHQAAPFRYFQKRVKGANDRDVVVNLYGIMQPSSFFEESLRQQDPRAFKLVQEAVDLARSHKMQYFGLGQFTSIVSENGLLLKSHDMPLTTGNSLTVGMTIEALKKVAKDKGIDLAKARVGIVGFTGNICNVLTQVLADMIPHLVLVHREPYAESKKYQEAVELLLANSNAQRENLVLSHDVTDLQSCEIIVAGTNSSVEFITSEHVRKGAVILDVSVPSNVHPEVRGREDVTYFQGGLSKLPFEQVVDHPWVPLYHGDCFACMAETIVMGLMGVNSSYSLGRLNKKLVVDALEMAKETGVTLGRLR